MKKIALIGNSHIACIREAWVENPRNMNIVFFGSHSNSLLNTSNKNNKIVATNDVVSNNLKMTSGGLGLIDIGDYDLIVLHGLMSTPNSFLHLKRAKNSNIFYSSEVIRHTNPYFKSISYHLVKEIRKSSNVPIFISHVPYPATKNPYPAVDPAEHNEFVEMLESTIADDNIFVLSQHPDTIIDFRHTKEKYSKGSKRLNVQEVKGTKQHPEDDIAHMNKEFGDLYLQNLEAHLEQKSSIG